MPTPTEHVIGFPRESTRRPTNPAYPRPWRACCARRGSVLSLSQVFGAGVFCDDVDLTAQGVRFATPDEVWAAALVLRYKSADPKELARLRPGQSIGALFHAEGDRALLSALATSKATAYSSASRYLRNAPAGVRVAVNTPANRGTVLAEADLVVEAIL